MCRCMKAAPVLVALRGKDLGWWERGCAWADADGAGDWSRLQIPERGRIALPILGLTVSFAHLGDTMGDESGNSFRLGAIEELSSKLPRRFQERRQPSLAGVVAGDPVGCGPVFEELGEELWSTGWEAVDL